MKTLKPMVPTLGQTTSTTPGWQPDSVRGNRHERGYGWQWEIKRERIRDRANDICEPHLAQGLVHKGKECDHIVPKAHGGSDDDSNLQWVCVEYHREKTARESNRGGG